MDSVKSVIHFHSKKSQASDAVAVSCKNISPYGERLGKTTLSFKWKKRRKTPTSSIFTVYIYFSRYKL